jgi:Mrp family chromosome partitioning ATPase
VAADGAEPFRFEPTVFGAVRRYRVLVLVVAVFAMMTAVGYSLIQPKVYQTSADVTVPLPVSSPVVQAAPSQYLDSQVLLLQSQGVAKQAAALADRQLGGDRLDASAFSGPGSSLLVDPPTMAAPGSYGANIVSVSFRGPSAEIAQVGLSAVLQAFREAISAATTAQADATIAGINQAISQTGSSAQRASLEAQRGQTVVDERTNLARLPTAAVEPTTRANGHWARNGGIGLAVGIMAGAALAFGLASRRRGIAGRQDPAAIYGVPMIAETPAFKAGKAWRSKQAPGEGLLPMAADPDSAVAEAFRFAAVAVERVCAANFRPSLAFVSPLTGAGKTTIVANLALAMAEGGARLLAVDADAAPDGLTARLLPGIPIVGDLEQVLDGKRALADCIKTSPFDHAVAVLGSSPAAPRQTLGAARSRAVAALLAEAKASFDVVLIDGPALLQVADAAELVSTADAAVIVVNPNERIPDHLEMAERLKPIRPDVVGYWYNRAPARSYAARHRHDGLPRRPTARPAPEVRPRLASARAWGGHKPSQQTHR